MEFALKVSARTAATTAVAVALVRRDHIRDAAAWVNWARERFGLEGSYLHHLHKVGKMLIGLRECLGDTQRECCNNTVNLYRRLFATDWDKLYAVTRIPAEQLAAFLSRLSKPVDKMTRGEVRAAVAEWLGEAGRRRRKVPSRISPVSTGRSIRSGGSNRRIWSRRSTTTTRPRRVCAPGMGLLGAALEFEKRRECPDVATLQAAKAALLSEVEEIEAVIAKAL